MAGRFDGKVIVITGGAGDIGRATALRFASEGAAVAVVDLPGPGIGRTMDLVKQAGGTVIGIGADVTKSGECERYAAETVAQLGGVDYLFNNAGIEGQVSPLTEYPEDVFDRVIAVNLKGVFLGMKAITPKLIARGGGVIINTASTAGLRGTPHLIAYGASKHAVIGMTKSAAAELAPHNIRVNAVCPGPQEGRMMGSINRQRNPDDPNAARAGRMSGLMLRRYGDPKEIAALVAFLCSDEAGFATGGAYTMDGGSTAT